MKTELKDNINKARLESPGHMPLYNIRCIDTIQQIWVGDRIITPSTKPDDMLVVYFSRLKKGDKPTELDEHYPEFHIKDASVKGVEFWLIPRQRMLFGYMPEPKGGVLLTDVRPQQGRLFRP